MHDFQNRLKGRVRKRLQKIASLYFNYCWAFLLALVVYMVADHSKRQKEEAAFQHETIP